MLDDQALDLIFCKARSYSHPESWLDKPVHDDDLRRIWDLAKMAPTSANQLPARVVWVKNEAGKNKLNPCLSEGNVEKTMRAPVTAIVGHDLRFYDKLPYTFPHTDAKSWFTGTGDDNIREHAFRNGTLQGAFLMMAARALGFDCGPMSGFDQAKVNQTFFAGTHIQANFLINIGYGNRDTLFPRAPRLSFDEACQIV